MGRDIARGMAVAELFQEKRVEVNRFRGNVRFRQRRRLNRKRFEGRAAAAIVVGIIPMIVRRRVIMMGMSGGCAIGNTRFAQDSSGAERHRDDPDHGRSQENRRTIKPM